MALIWPTAAMTLIRGLTVLQLVARSKCICTFSIAIVTDNKAPLFLQVH